MSYSITLAFANSISPAQLRELVESLGGETDPDKPAGAILSRGRDQVWVSGPDEDDEVWEYDPEDDIEYEQLLGGPIADYVSLAISRSPGSPRLAMELIEAAAAHGWRLIVDNGYGPMTLDALRERAARFSSVFWEAPWDWK